jgi:DNA-binding ferritin-like protein (Dps family)
MTKQEALELSGMYDTKTIKSQRYMQCRNSIPDGPYWKGHFCNKFVPVGNDIVQVLCNTCVQRVAFTPIERQAVVKSDRPRGWQLWKEYVDSDGNVFFKGIEQPFLKGSLPPTEIKEKTLKDPIKKLSRKEKEEMKADLGKDVAKLKSSLMQETRKTFRAEISKELKQKTKRLEKLL